MSKRGKYLIIDTETTGLSPTKNGLIQLAAAALDKKLEVLGTICFDICPANGTYQIDAESLEINGFTEERIAGGVSYAKAREKFKKFCKKHFSVKPIAVAQFWPFDFAVMESLFADGNENKYFAKEIMGNDFIDTKALVNYANLKADLKGQKLPFPKTSLSKAGGLKDILGLEGKYVAHDALGDVMATRDVLLALLQKDYL